MSPTAPLYFLAPGDATVTIAGAGAADLTDFVARYALEPQDKRRIVDISIRFLEILPADGTVYFKPPSLGIAESGEWVAVERTSGRKTRIKFPETADGPIAFDCQPGMRRLPLLEPLMKACLATKGLVSFHASAFRYRERNIVVAGLPRSGKTSALMAFTSRGAEFIGDDWIIVDPGSGQVAGVPSRLDIADYQLDLLPRGYCLPLTSRLRARLGGLLRRSRILLESRPGLGSRSRLQKSAGLLGKLESAMRIDIPARQVFPHRLRKARGLDEVYLLVSSEAATAGPEEIPSDDMAKRMDLLMRWELAELSETFRAHALLRPEKPIPEKWSGAFSAQESRLRRVLAGTKCCVVRHPFPTRVPTLFSILDGAVGR